VQNREILRNLASLGDYAGHVGNCSAAIVLASHREGPEFSRSFDLGRVAQSLMLVAAEDGWGSCIAVFEPRANMIKAAQLLDIPSELEVDLALAFGRANSSLPLDGPSPSPSGRMKTAELLSVEHFRAAASEQHVFGQIE